MSFDHKKNLDLHESEWSKAGKNQPILGHGAYWFFRVALPAGILTLIFGLIWKTIVIAVLG